MICGRWTADTAGIRAGDVIVSIGGTGVRSVESFLAELRRHNPGAQLEIGTVRDDQRLTIPVVLSDGPSR